MIAEGMGGEKEAGEERGLVYRAVELNKPQPWLLLRLVEVLRGRNGRQEKEGPRTSEEG